MKQAVTEQSDIRHRSAASTPVASRSSTPASVEFTDNRPEAVAQRRLVEAIHNSPSMVAQQRQLHSLFGETAQLMGGPEEEDLVQAKVVPVQRQGPEDEELLQGKFEVRQRKGLEEEEPLQSKFEGISSAQLKEEAPKPNASTELSTGDTGLPDNLKSGIESLSGLSMDNVSVHYNSSQPARLNALAYTQGTEIHVAPGQEQHLPHEAWHVVQQAQGRVQPTMQLKDGMPVNDDQGLEHEADVMGRKAAAGEVAHAGEKSIKPETVGSLLGVVANSFGQAAIQKQRNRRRWTPQQRAQSEKFWKHKQAKEQRKEQNIQAYIEGMRRDHGIEVEPEQAEVLSANGYSREEVGKACAAKMSVKDIVGLCLSGFTRWAVQQAAKEKWNLKKWTGEKPPVALINQILETCNVKPWIESEHDEAKKAGEQQLYKNKEKIAKELKVNTNRASGGAFLLDPETYVSACTFDSVGQGLQFRGDLVEDIFALIKMRKAKCKSEHAIQTGDKIFFKGKAPGDSTVVHELIHFFGAQDRFIENFCFGRADGINEGFTEFFARQVITADKNRQRGVYTYEVKAVEFMAKCIGNAILKDAYFTGNVDELKREYKSKIGAEWTPEEEDRILRFPTIKK
ncbi:MAG: hypothetical protein OJF50_003778 [Nitrospira sp.]|jgi:hypothetical protein|nr:hypothetical protein [Nitrospira sp.]